MRHYQEADVWALLHAHIVAQSWNDELCNVDLQGFHRCVIRENTLEDGSRTLSFALWPLLFHCFIVFRDRRSVQLQHLFVCSLPAHSSLAPSLSCQHFLLVLLSTLRQDFVLLTPSGASPLRQKPSCVENVHSRDLLNFNCETMATSWLASSCGSYSSNSLPRTGLYADVTLNCCSSFFTKAGSVDFLAVLLSDCGFSIMWSSSWLMSHFANKSANFVENSIREDSAALVRCLLLLELLHCFARILCAKPSTIPGSSVSPELNACT